MSMIHYEFHVAGWQHRLCGTDINFCVLFYSIELHFLQSETYKARDKLVKYHGHSFYCGKNPNFDS